MCRSQKCFLQNNALRDVSISGTVEYISEDKFFDISITSSDNEDTIFEEKCIDIKVYDPFEN